MGVPFGVCCPPPQRIDDDDDDDEDDNRLPWRDDVSASRVADIMIMSEPPLVYIFAEANTWPPATPGQYAISLSARRHSRGDEKINIAMRRHDSPLCRTAAAPLPVPLFRSQRQCRYSIQQRPRRYFVHSQRLEVRRAVTSIVFGSGSPSHRSRASGGASSRDGSQCRR